MLNEQGIGGTETYSSTLGLQCMVENGLSQQEDVSSCNVSYGIGVNSVKIGPKMQLR